MTDHTTEHEVADFDAFFAEHAEPRFGAVLRLYRREYVLPTSLPLLFTLQMERVKDSDNPDDIRRLLSSLFGPAALDEWAEHGMTDRQLGVVLVWAAANAREPGCLSMREAAELYDEREADREGDEGKAPRPTPATIRAGSGKQS
ncbi:MULTISPECIES: hypothetical protein [Actinomycetes]|uniref:Tail assembly chaperone n=1 Tax=Streptomyces gilvosporeus TaxID=553510 RepID=A0A1V0TSY7_9ACTN|nr:hypothetical protein [Streptomyces gilvosporeus]ARF56003.1 hypothetical protein B1H19_19040 [Streptomyces gilvosporeus]